MSKHQFVTQTNLRWKWRRQRRAKSNHSDKQQQQQQLNCIVCTNYENPSHTHTDRHRHGGKPPTKAKGKGNVEGLLSFWHILMRIYKTASLASLSLSLCLPLSRPPSPIDSWSTLIFGAGASEQARVVSPFARTPLTAFTTNLFSLATTSPKRDSKFNK